MNVSPTIVLRGAARSLIAAAMLAAGWAAAGADATNQPVFHATFRAATEAAAADQSLVLLIFGAEWCGPCQQLKSDTLSSPEFIKQGGPLHIAEVDVDSSQKLAHDFAVETIPALVLLTADGKITGRHVGFLDTDQLLAFLENGRRRAQAGQWDGSAPARPLDEYLKKEAADTLTTNDLQHLVEMLGEPDPADRSGIAAILLAKREQAVPWLIDSVNHPYLGVRIGAADLLQRLAPGLDPIDPWQSSGQLASTAANLKKWWAATGALPPQSQVPAADPALQNSIKAGLEKLRGDDPVRRTEAMSALAAVGPAALPAVRDAIRHAEHSGDQRVIGWLEDVRWAILIPDALETRAGGVRKTLARGASLERQAAAERLGKIGADALGALTELVNDNDSLVAESAARAMSEIGGDNAIPGLAALLTAADSNLRMTAAQALGHTKSPDAIKPLLTVVDDPNEVVACTALAAVVEARSSSSRNPGNISVPDEIAVALRRCLGDPRWRVRAAAAETSGKLGAHEVVQEAKKLLDDPDGFVVQKALAALNELGAPPDIPELVAIARRLPGLRAGAVEMMLQSRTKESVDAVTGLFNSSDAAGQTAVLQAMSGQTDGRDAAAWELGLNHSSFGNANAGSTEDDLSWKPLLTKAASSPDPRVRRGAAAAFLRQPPALAAEMIAPLLADEDAATRVAAADVVLSILVTQTAQAVPRRLGVPAKTNTPPASPAQIASWHAAMLQRTNGPPSLSLAAAVLVTGDVKSDLPLVLAALDNPDTTLARRNQDATAIGLIISKLPWPDGRSVLDKLSAAPLLFAMAAEQSGRATDTVADYLLEPARFKSAVEPISGDTLKSVLALLAGFSRSLTPDEVVYVNGVAQGGMPSWDLWGDNGRVKAITLALTKSTNAAWRAVAIYSLGLRADAAQNTAIFKNALTDGDEWVRRAAVQTLARHSTDRPALEAVLGPLLSDTNLLVAGLAAELLMEPEVRGAAYSWSQSLYFEFNGIYGGSTTVLQNFDTDNERPLTTLEGKPAFLDPAAKWAATAKPADSVPFVLLLAQYGRFDGLDRLVALGREKNAAQENVLDDAILTGIALSQDAKYMPVLVKMVAAEDEDSALRKILRALQGMRGADARQLRLDINKKLRAVNSP